jgi:NO-binding membrane sensor protein with MHYT domain
MVVTGTYNPYLVALSALVASFASYTALDLGGHVGPARGFARRMWLVAAAITMGGGIWSMHFVAMLAFIMPTPTSYDIGLTILSLVAAIFVTGGGFYVISRQSGWPLRLVVSSIFMGLGIAGMHYTGMAAMRGHAELSYDPLFVALSLVIAIGASTVALWLAFRTTVLGQKLVAAVVMGLAISGMHYTAMRAAIFTAHGSVHEAQVNGSLDQTNLALAVAGITFIILAFASVASLFERKRAEEALRQAQADLAQGCHARDNLGRADRLDRPRGEPTARRRRRQRRGLPALARPRNSRSGRSAPLRGVDRQGRHSGGRGDSARPCALEQC